MKTALVTGASGGIGEALCRNLAARGYRVLAHARTKEKAEGVGDYATVFGDVTTDEAVASIAQQVLALGGADLVIHNAGVLTKTKKIGPHGYGMQGEVNVIAPYALTKALDAAGALRDGATVLVNSSSGANFARRTDYETLAKPDGSSLFGQYALSKAAANALVPRMATDFPAYRFVSVEPGFVKTKMTAGNADMPWIMALLAPILGASPDKAARRVLDHALTGDVPSGTVLQGRKVMGERRWTSPAARDSIDTILGQVGLAA